MKILRHPELDEREFGRAAVRVEHLRDWVRQVGAMLPPTIPIVDDFDAVQLESFLVAIERGAAEGPAAAVVLAATALLNEPDAPSEHPATRAMIEDEHDDIHARWFLGAKAHQRWREKLAAAVCSGALHTIDAMTGLPTASPSPSPKTTMHSTKQERRDEVDVIVDAAIAACGTGADVARLWAHLQKVASDKADAKPGTLIGFDEDGLKYSRNGQAAWITRDAFAKRIRRRATP